MQTTPTISPEKQKELEERMKKGNAGELWRIEVIFKKNAGETGRHTLDNQTGAELMNFRAQIFTCGLLFPIDPGHWKVISPWDLLEIDVWRQKKYY